MIWHLTEDDMDNMPLKVKKHICHKVLGYASRLLWLEEILIEFRDASYFSFNNIDAIFEKEYFIIFVNENWLERAKFVDIVATVLHETRHAYQCAQVEFYENMEYQEPEEKVKQWKLDLENYLPSTGNEHNDMVYMKQSIEIDAVAFEMKIMKELLNIDLEPHEFIAQEIEKINIAINERVSH